MTTNPSQAEAVLNTVAWYGRLGRPLTAFEVWRASDATASFPEIAHIIETLVHSGRLREADGFLTLPDVLNGFSLARRVQDFAADRKWRRLRRLARLFRHLPFVDFVFASGSMALGNVTASSDFDLLIGVRHGRLFSARYFALALFATFGVRRTNDREDSSPNKLCLNHLVTEASYGKPPWNRYRRELYRNLVPLSGKRDALAAFREANRPAGPPATDECDLRYVGGPPSAAARFLEFVLGGRLGDLVERTIAAPVARRRLNRYLARREYRGLSTSASRVVISNEELEFHFDLRYETGLAPARGSGTY
ncbi:MAG: hypothetical protein AAB601_00645 [Patescibacteria group bacterium]